MANYQYTELLNQMLDMVPNEIDKREGSIIYTTLSPVAFLLSQQNYMLSYMFNLLFADTAEGVWLTRVTSDFGIDREAASHALRQINTYDREGEAFDVPLSSRFAINDITFSLTERIATGQYKAECEQLGTIGNLYTGTILPVDNINSLGSAELVTDPLIPAADEESDEHLRERFYLAVRRSPYGGNIADYEERTLEIEGVGAVQVFNAVSQGPGHVGLIIGDEQGGKATEELITRVQTLMGVDGDGIAPIGHTVTVATGINLPIDVSAEIKMKTGASFDIVKPVVEQAVQNYIDSVGFSDTTVFYAKLVADILNCHESILDVGTVTMNGVSANLSLEKTFSNFQLAVIGEITVSEVTA